MIQPNELRVGNLIYTFDTDYQYGPDNQFLFKIKEIGNCLYSEDSSAGFDEIYPIPLTPEILEKCGFKGNYPSIGILGDGPILEIYYKDGGLFFVGSEFTYNEPKIQYLHQLQNLYFALTGEELAFTL